MLSPGKTPLQTVSLLGGFCFFLSAIEHLIPKPLPFIRLGLANLPMLMALDILPFPLFALLAGLKIIGQALISGTIFSYVFLFSLGGSAVSALIMYALRRGPGKERISLIGVSAAGALASNGVTLALAYFFVFGSPVRYAAAPVLALGIVTGTLLGIICEYFIRRSRWYAQSTQPGNIEEQSFEQRFDTASQYEATARTSPGSPCRMAREAFCRKTFRSGELALAGLCMIPALLFNADTCSRAIQFLFFFFLAWLSGKKINPLLTLSVILGIVFFNLLVPYGEILFSIGPLAVTSGALMGGIRAAVTLEGLFMLSGCCARRDLALPGVFGEILGEAFRVFSRLTEGKHLFNRQNWAERLDWLFLTLENERAGGKNKPPGVCRAKPGKLPGACQAMSDKLLGKIILAAAVILAWLPLLLFRA